jgi:hypothetical protein
MFSAHVAEWIRAAAVINQGNSERGALTGYLQVYNFSYDHVLQLVICAVEIRFNHFYVTAKSRAS